YAYRLPIGTMEVVDNFAPQALRDYYEKWYRPDLQGIIVVGDIDVDRMESAIKRIFGDIPAPVNPAERVYYPVPDTKGRIFAIGKDKEQPQAIIDIMIKHDATPDSVKNTVEYAMREYVVKMITSMLNNRLSDMTSNPATAFSVAGTSYDDFFMSKTKECFDINAVGKGDSITPAFEEIYRELLRALRGGFTVGEYQRAKAKYMSAMEEAYNNRATTPSTSYGFELVRHFLDNESVPGIEAEYQLAQMMTNMIPLEAINAVLPQLVKLDDNVVVMALLPENDTYVVPTAEELAAVMARVEAEDIAPYVDEIKSEPLIPELPAPGSITATRELPQYDAVEWTLSNGAKVIAKITDFKDDEILMQAIARGGYSTTTAAPNDIQFLSLAMWQSGLGSYTSNDMEKYLAGKRVSLKPSFRELYRSLSGNCAPKDISTLMEMIYMTFTDYTITEDEFNATKAMVTGLIQNQLTTPEYNFQRELYKFLYPSPYEQALTMDVVEQADRQTSLDIIHDMLADVDDYTFVFVGNLDLDT
ncbi:MAG: insulinase family protein, partial [Muribaculum sp.]|nr:insulinase family protein [Muribaculum sp.]